MTRPRKLDEQLWEDSEEELSSDHVVERFFSQHERVGHEAPRKAPVAPKARRRASAPPESDD